MQVVVDAFCERRLKAGDEVIRQGDLVNSDEPGLYVIENGKLDVYKCSQGQQHPGANGSGHADDQEAGARCSA